MDILPTNDLLFKKIFTSHGNEDILLEFVNDMLGTSFTSVVPRETYDIKKIKSKKLNYTEVDVRAQTEEGKYVTIEMQVQNHESFWPAQLITLAEPMLISTRKKIKQILMMI